VDTRRETYAERPHRGGERVCKGYRNSRAQSGGPPINLLHVNGDGSVTGKGGQKGKGAAMLQFEAVGGDGTETTMN